MTEASTEASKWLVHGSRRVYASPWVNVDLDDVEIPGGRRFEHHVLRYPGDSAGALATDGDRALLVWRHRFIPDAWGWEIPAGWVDEGEHPADAAARELREETGYRADAVHPLVSIAPMNGITAHRFHLFGCTAERVAAPDPTEAAQVAWLPLAELRELLRAGEITDGATVTALTYHLALG